MTRWIAPSVLGLLALASVIPGPAMAQTTSPPPTTTTTSEESPGGAFDKLSPGNRKIGRALFEGQKTATTESGSTLTLDEIAARKQNGEGWGAIFKDMKSQGLVQAKSLGELVSKQSRHSGGVVTTASGRTLSEGDRGHGWKGSKGHDGDAAAVSGRSNPGHGGEFSRGSGSGHGRSGGGSGHGRGK